MREVRELIQIDFDNMENRNPKYEKSLGLFMNDETTSHKKISEFVINIKDGFYLGWDGEIYPKFRIEKKKIA